jgi:prepilin-type N-terminal cleavage/methylation domain-containing protein
MTVQRQAGFTLIETILVMAIGAGLAAMALLGFSNMRGQTQFSDSVERIKEQVISRRQEALSTIKVSGTGATACRVTLGKVLTFNPGSSTVTVETISGDNVSAPASLGCPVQPIQVVDSSTTDIAWGVVYVNSSRGNGRIQVAFVRSGTDGTLATAVSPNGGWATPYTLANFTPNGTPVNINLRDPSGRQAYLTVTPTNNSISRTFP